MANIDKLNALIMKKESETLEFKTSTAQLKPAFETICAFLNGKGGIVLVGVNDKGSVVGQTVSDRTRQEIAAEVGKLEPTAQIDISYVLVNGNGNKFVIMIQVTAGRHAPYIYDGRAFQRHQSTTSRMSQHRYEQLLVARGQLNYAWEEMAATGYDLSDLDFNEIYKTVSDGVRENRMPASAQKEDIKDILARLHLIDRETGQLKRAAIVLYAKQTSLRLVQCMMKMARFKGTDKLGNFIDNQQIHGHAFCLLAAADAFLRRHLSIASFFKTDQFKRIDQPALPVLAVREALINALCHRDYANRSTDIALAIFDDRLEIWNGGALPEPLKIADLKRPHHSFPRNKLIAKVFHLTGLIESWGTGTNKMIQLCKADRVPPPSFKEYAGGFSVTFRFKAPLSSITGAANQHPLNQRQIEILAIIKKHGLIRLKDIESKLINPPSQRMVQKDLSALREKGLIELKGYARSAAWHLKNAI